MMTGDHFSNEVTEPRVVLGDVTNRSVKRGFSSITDLTGLKSGDQCGENVVCEGGDSSFAKQVCLGIENLVREKCKTKFGVKGGNEKNTLSFENEKGRDLSPVNVKINSSQENIASAVSLKPNEKTEKSTPLEGNANFVKNGKILENVVEVGEGSRDSCSSSASIRTTSGPGKTKCDEGKFTSDTNQSTPVTQEFISQVCSNDHRNPGIGGFAGAKHGAVEWSRLPKSHGTRSFELERCTALKGQRLANLNAGSDLLKACSCSFCQKAAYIWSDLQYQDIKGRIGALRKSQKEASILVNRYSRGKQTDIHGQGSANSSSKLESDLTLQWRSLFHHMENIIAHENNQLQASYVALRDLREDCKIDLERSTGLPSEKY